MRQLICALPHLPPPASRATETDAVLDRIERPAASRSLSSLRSALRFARGQRPAACPFPFRHDGGRTGGGAHFALRGRSVVCMTAWSHGAQTHWIGELTSRGYSRKVRAGVSRSALSLLHLTAAASQPIQWPRVACGSCPGRVLFFLPVPSGLFHAGHGPGDRPSRRAGYGRKKPARGVSRSAGLR